MSNQYYSKLEEVKWEEKTEREKDDFQVLIVEYVLDKNY